MVTLTLPHPGHTLVLGITNLVIDCKYLLAQDFNSGLAHVIKDYSVMTKEQYFINKDGNKVIDTNNYYIVLGFEGDICLVENADGEYGVINKDGELIIGNFDN